jgi:hypothetical protein
LRETAQSLGLDTTNLGSDADFARELARRYRETQPYAQYAQQLLAQQQQAAPPTPTAPTEPKPEEWTVEGHFSKAYPVPPFSDGWTSMIQQGVIERDPQTNQWVPTPQYPWLKTSPELLALNDFESKRQQFYQEQFYQGNLYRNMWDVFQEPIKRLVESRAAELYDSRSQQQQTTGFIDKFEQDNRTWLYDDKGQVTDRGKQLYSAIDRVKQASTPEQILELAMSLVGPQTPQPIQPPVAPTASATSAVPPGVASTPQESFLDKALERAKHSPSSGGASVQSPEFDPVVAARNEIENLFVNALKSQAAV